jgi:large repetitive protein
MGVWAESWTATDDCGNTVTVERYVTILDSTPPVIENPEDMTIQCDEVDGLIDPETINIYDNCALDVDVVFTETIQDGICEDSYTIVWHWTATDYCDNMSEATTTITVQDTTNPTWIGELPQDMTLECDMDIPAAWCPDAEDNCDNGVMVELTETITDGDCPQEYVIERICRAFDNCGNMIIHASYVTIIDTTAPIVVPAVDLTLDCDEDAPAADYSVTDNCDENPSVVVTENVENGDCPQEYVLTRTYTATDACGNTSSADQVITVQDTTAPVVIPAGDLTLECDEVVPAADYSVTDNCDENPGVVVTSSTVNGDCPQEYAMTRTYTATDACGNESSATQVITVQDTTAPVVVAAADETIECDMDLPEPSHTVSDNCDTAPVVVVTSVVVDGDCPQEYIMTRTYTATDACGNTSSDEQVITVQDTTAPVVVAADDMTIECDMDLPEPSYTVSDNCDLAPVVVVTAVIVDGDCPQAYAMTRTYTATDACGNTSSDEQVITVQDTTAPELIGVPEDAVVNCNDPMPDAIVSATDNCDEELIVSVTAVTTPQECGWLFVRTWCVTDDCGNETCATQTITVVDLEAPEFTYVPEDIIIECSDDIPAVDAEVSAEDNCSEFVITFDESIVEGDCPQQYDIVRCWTVTDVCDNAATACQTIHVIDSTAPVYDPFEIFISLPCDEVEGIFVSATDNCGEVTITYEDTPVSGGCLGNVIRDYTAFDECGNSTMTQQIIMLIDEVAPVATYVPEDMVIECDQMIAEDTATFEDNCDDDLTIECSENMVDQDCGYMIVHTCNATDHCGNETTVMWTITVTDTTAPQLDLSSTNGLYECDMEAMLPTVEVTDNCDENPEVSMTMMTEAGDCPQHWFDIYTWTATDNCGNTTTATYTAEFNDTTAPTWESVPANQEIACNEVPVMTNATALDNCGTVTVTPTETMIPGECAQTYAVVTTWTAMDECGNSSTAESVVYYSDTMAPTWDFIPSDISVQCAGDVPEVNLTATDNCGTPMVVCTSDVQQDDQCGNRFEIVTCTATDECGNSTTLSYTITVQDTEAPDLIGVPANMVIDCQDEVPNAPEVTATDNCDDDLVVTMTEEFFGDLPDPDADSDCNIINPNSEFYDVDWGMLFQPGTGDLPTDYYFTGGDFLTYPDGSAHITGQAVSYSNANAGFDVDVWFENGLDWADWSTQDFPTSYKDDFGLALEHHLDWWYYILNEGSATLVGYGDYAGSLLELSHAPSNYYYGFQVGVAANNVNGEYGAGGWFFYEGIFVENGESPVEVTGAGDFAFDLDCCPEYFIERTWCVADCSGNTTCSSQMISFDDLDGVNYVPADLSSDFFLDEEDYFGFTFVGPNPAVDVVVVKFMSNTTNMLTLTLTDSYGHKISTLFNGTVSEMNIYDAVIDVYNLNSGIYIATLSSSTSVKTQKIVVAH